jgi:hypothetical protein
MATKVYCDICSEVIPPNTFPGVFVKRRLGLSLFPGGPGSKGAMSARNIPEEEVLDLCEPCQKSVDSFLSNRKTDLEKQKSDVKNLIDKS